MPDPQANELVQALNVDPTNPPDLTVLNGFFGPSVDEAHIRMYRNVFMNVWQDIPRDQIMHIDKIERGPASPFGEDVVWMLRRDARALDAQTSKPGANVVVSPAVVPPQPPVDPVQPPVDPVQPPVDPLDAGTDAGDDFGDGGYGGYNQLWPPKG
jgi:hypothetical protein